MPTLTVVRPGMLTTVQDRGRWGYQHLGVPVAGPMDWYSHALTNRCLGNPETAATLEVTLLGPELEADDRVTCLVRGAAFETTVDGRLVPTDGPIELRAGQRLRFGARQAGTRAYLGVAGGFAVEATLGSRATSLTSAMGPFGGRALTARDVLPVGGARGVTCASLLDLPMPSGGARLRVMLGPHDASFPPDAIATVTTTRYTITPESNRMGYRLSGAAIDTTGMPEMLSDATPLGSIQVPAAGQPILLMADRQTTGGYPRIATVITADLPLAGQLAPGDWIEFEPCSAAAAAAALQERLRTLRGVA